MASRASNSSGLTVAVTGPTGEIGQAFVAALERSREVHRVLGMARRPFDPAARGGRADRLPAGAGAVDQRISRASADGREQGASRARLAPSLRRAADTARDDRRGAARSADPLIR
jgi:hypothetical protein